MSHRVAKTKFKTSLKLVASSLCVVFFAEVSLAASFSLTYSGRLTQQTGAPLDGPVDITVKFWTSASAGNTLGTPIDFANVALNQGVFTLPLELTPAQISAIFGDGTDPVFIEVTAAGKTYPRQHYTYVPLALRVPVDTKTLAFDADGKLGLSLTSLPSANQFLTKDSNGRLSWGSPAVTTLQGQTIASATPSSGQVLTFNGGQWVPTTLTSSGSGSVSGSGMQPAGNYLTALTGDVVATGPGSSTATLASVALPGTATKVTFDVKGRVTAGTSLTSADITTALGYTPLNKDGSTPLTGNWAVGGKDITGVGNLALSSNSTFALGAYTTDPTSLTAIDAGKMWYNGGSLKFWNGSAVQTLGVAGTGTAGVFTKVTTNAEGQVTSGTTLASSDIPDLDASKITSGLLGVARGGTGLASGNGGGIPYFSDANTLASSSPLALNGIVLGGGSNGAPTSTAALSNGQLLIGSTGAAPVPASLSSGANAGVTVTTGAGAITLDTAQDIRPTASPTFATVNAATLASETYVAGSSDNSASPGVGMLRAANATGSDVAGGNLVLAGGNGTGTGGSGGIQFNTAAPDVTSETANTLATRMTITPSGNVGIGTTAPAAKVELYDTIQANPRLILSGQEFYQASNTSTSGIAFLAGVNRTNNRQLWIGDSAALTPNTTNQVVRIVPNFLAIDAIGTDGVTAKQLQLGNEAGLNLRGNVGIGTTSPSSNLVVANVTPAFPANSGTTSTSGLRIHQSTLDNSVLEFGIKNATTGIGGSRMGWIQVDLGTDLSVTYPLLLNPNGGNIGIGTTNPLGLLDVNQKLTVLSGGNVGIGTTNPLGLLDVNQKLTVLSGGNIGIGTSSPAQKLDVAGVIRSSSGGIMFPDGSIMTSALPTPSAGYNSTTDLNLAADSSGNGTGNISVSTKGTERVRITNSGNIGIGTTAPGYQLTLAGNSLAFGVDNAAYFAAKNSTGTYENYLWPRWSDNVMYLNYGSAGFNIRNNSSVSTMFMAHAGNVGIGTTTPQSKLDINGAAAIGSYAGTTSAPTNSLIVSGNIGVGTSIPSQPLEVAGVIKSSSGGFMFPDGSVMTTAASTGSNGSSSTTDLNLNSDSGAAGSGDIMLSTRGAERMRIANSGNVGIGTSNPADKLFVWSTKESTVTPQTPGLAVGDASLANTGVGGGIAFWGNYTGTTPIAGATIHAMKNNATAGDTGFNLAFNTRPNAGKPTERMRITSTGNVGIGTTAPGYPLQVSNAGSAAYVGVASFLAPNNTTAGNASQFNFGQSVSTGNAAEWRFVYQGNNNTGNRMDFGFTSYVTPILSYNVAGNVGIGTTAPSTKLAVAGSGSFTGNVGIGTTIPTQALEVAGTIKSSTGGIMFPDGTVMASAASPSTGSSSITDLNLGADIGAAGSGVLSFSTAGTERMRVANNGNVGIGTTSPIYQLDVVNPSGPGYVRIQGNQTLGTTRAELILDRTSAARGAGIRMQSTGDSAAQWWAGIPYVGGGSSDLFQIGRHSSSPEILANAYMLITSTGNVGIGTTSPQRLLDLNSGASGGLTEQLVLRNAGASTTAGTGAGLYFALTNASTSRHAAIDALISNAATGATDLTLSTTDGTSITEKMRIQAGGSVAIGTTTPFNKLTVAGNADFTGKVGIGSNIPTQALDVAGVIRSSTGGIMFPDGSVMTSAATPGTGTSSTGDLTFVADSGLTGTGVITFAARGSEKMRITNGGSIGFGTAGPLSKVDVAGGMAVGSYAGATAAPTNGLIVSGNVGIGTTAPVGNLDLGAVSGNKLVLFPISATSQYGLGIQNALLQMYTAGSTTDIAFGAGASTNFTELMRIKGNGNVGIGTTSPSSKLQLNGNAAIGYSTSTAGPTNGLAVSGNVGIGTTAPSQMLEVAGTIRSTSGGIMFPDGTVMTTASGGTSSGTTSVTDLAFASGTGTSSSGVITLATHNLERMRVDYNGNVGIGTAAPLNKLDVAGGVAIGSTYAGGTTAPSNGLIVQGNVGIGTTSPGALLDINKSGTNDPLVRIGGPNAADNPALMVQNASGTNALSIFVAGNAGSFVTGSVAGDVGLRRSGTGKFLIGSSSGASMAIDSNGNVGIGTTAPAALLDVSGAKSAAPSLTGAYIGLSGPTFTDNSTAASGTAANMAFNAIAAPTLASTNTSVTTSNAYTNYIAGAPKKGTNNTVTNAVALGIGAAAVGAQTNSYGLLVNAQTGATNNYTAVFSGGNVGIGSTAPAQRLDVAGAIRSSSGGFVFPDGTIMTTAVTATTAGATSTTDLNLVADSEAAGAGAIVVATNGTERMRVLNSGRVGIGTSIPQSALDVAGGMSLGSYAGVNAAPSNGLIVSGNVGIGTTAPITKLHSVSTGNTAVASAFLFGDYYGATLGVNSTSSSYYALNVVSGINSAGGGGSSLLYVRADGNVGIGTTSPASKLQVNGGAAIGYSTATTAPATGLVVAGNVGIGTTSPTQRLQVGTSGDGTVALANAWNTFSDIRLKRDLAVIPDALDKLLELHGYYYFWKNGSDQTRQIGVVAQEVEKILPELVHTGSDGIKTVDYPKLTAVLIEGTKQLKAEKDSEIAQLKARADAAEAEAAQLKQALCSKFPDLGVCSH